VSNFVRHDYGQPAFVLANGEYSLVDGDFSAREAKRVLFGAGYQLELPLVIAALSHIGDPLSDSFDNFGGRRIAGARGFAECFLKGFCSEGQFFALWDDDQLFTASDGSGATTAQRQPG
jgi:hypothetical protein